jgi:hypothetical protein
MGGYWQINLRHAVDEFTRKQLPVPDLVLDAAFRLESVWSRTGFPVPG